MITPEQYDNHDCHLSPEDSCSTCSMWFEQQHTTIPQRKQQLEDARKGAWGAYERGFYTLDDYFQFCHKNKILVF